MVEVKVKVKVKVSGQKGQKEPAKKTRKPRKDKGTKRRKRTKNPQFQTGSIDFRTIGTQQTMGQNATLLAGLISSRAVVPQYLQPQQPQQTSTELTTYAPRDLPKNVPPPQFEPDVEQGQEETPQSSQVRQAMGERIGRLRKEAEKIEEVSKQLQESNLMAGEELRQKQIELIEQDKAMDLKRKSFLVEQIYGTSNDTALARIKSQITGLQWTSAEIKQDKAEQGGIDNYRKYLVKQAGLDPELVDNRKVKAGATKERTDWFYNPQKADLQRAQEERTRQLVENLEDY